MIQRLQSVLLVLAAAANFALLFCPIWMVSNPDMETGESADVQATPLHVEYHSSRMSPDNPFSDKTIPFSENTFMTIQFGLVVAVSAYLLSLVFMYRNRQRQKRLVYYGVIALLIQFLMLIPIRSWLEEMVGKPANPEDYQSLPQWGLLLPVVALLLAWWAARRIDRDEKLVRDMDRIR